MRVNAWEKDGWTDGQMDGQIIVDKARRMDE